MPKVPPNGLSRTVVYGITFVPLLATLGFYFLEYVPSREEYFLNLRFRTLGVIGRQIESKLEGVSSGLTYAANGIHQAAPGEPPKPTLPEEYVRQVFPGLHPPATEGRDTPKPEAAYPDIRFIQSADRVRFIVGPTQIWEDSLAHLIRPLTDDGSFDDVLLATQSDRKAVVLFQRSDSTPKLRDISGLIQKSEAKDTSALQLFHRLHSDGGGSDADLLREVDLDGSGYRFLIQPLTIRVPRSPKDNVQELLLCGLIRSNTIRQEAFHVPPKYLLWIIVPLLAAVLSGPLLKLLLIRRTGRFETRDVPLVALFSCLAMAMLTIVLLTYHLSQENTKHLAEGSEGLANRVATQVRSCFERGREVLKQVDAFAAAHDACGAAPCQATNRTRIWSWPDLLRSAPAITTTNLEFVFWTSLSGLQIEKWTPLETNTPFFPQNSYTYFQQAVGHQYWRDEKDPGSPFTAELLISPTTSAPIAVLSMPSHRQAVLQTSAERRSANPSVPPALNAAFVSIVETPRDLLSPVIPPGMGFAMVRPDGSVLYHSDHARILNENLFLETQNSRALVDAVTTQSATHVDGRYRGSDVAFYVRPLGEVAGVPWTIVVFHEIEPWQTLVWQVGLDVLVLYLLVWVAPALLIPATMWCVKRWRDKTWNACRIEALRSFWPNETSARGYRVLCWMMGGLMAWWLAAMVWFGRSPGGVAGMVLLISALLPPMVVLGGGMWRIWCFNKSAPLVAQQALSPGSRASYLAAISLMLVSSSVLPVFGFFYLAFRMESEIDVRHWQWDLTGRVLHHRAAVESDIRRPERLSPEAIEVALQMELPNAADCDKEKLYQSWYSTVVECRPPAPIHNAGSEPSGSRPAWLQVLGFLRWRAIGLESDTVRLGEFPRGHRTNISRPQLAYRAADTNVIVSSDVWFPALLPRSFSWWILAVVLIAGGCIWVWVAASRLFLFGFYRVPLRNLRQLRSDDWNHPILVLGLPRSGKDGAVREFIKELELQCATGAGQPAMPAVYNRLDLKTAKLDADWLSRALGSLALRDFYAPPVVNQQTLTQSFLTSAAAAGNGGASMAVRSRPEAGGDGERTPNYVHVTNLEAAVENRDQRNIAMSLLDTLVKAQAAGLIKLIVTSVIDPIFHYGIIFPEEVEKVDSDHLPESGFGRWSHLFLQFERVLAEEDEPQKQRVAARCNQNPCFRDLWEECKYHPSLWRTAETISQDLSAREKRNEPLPTREQMVQEVCEKASALYTLLWSACTRPEKLLLVQLAQTGLVNPICKSTLHEVIRKRLVEMKPYPMVMNESFTRYLESAASSKQIEKWEKEDGESHWLTIRNVLLIVLVFAFLMIGISQDHVLQSIAAILTAVVGGIGGVFKLSDTIASKWGPKANGAPHGTSAAG